MATSSSLRQGRRRLIIAIVVASILAVVSIVAALVFLLRLPIPPYIPDSVVYASLFGLMAIGLTLTYITTKVPNFAYGSFVTIGIYTSFSLFRLNHLKPYLSTPIAFIVGALSSVVMYLGVLRMLARRGSSLVGLMISTLAIDIAFVGIFGIYSDYLYTAHRVIYATNFPQLPGDFSLFGVPGIAFAAPYSLAMITLGLF